MLKQIIKKALSLYKTVYEIHLFAGRSVYILTGTGIKFIKSDGSTSDSYNSGMLIPSEKELEEILDRAISYSGFIYEKEMKKGYVTYGGGCRMGICSDKGERGFGGISSLCIRIPADADNIKCDPLTDTALNEFLHGILITGAPSSGKTTMLRYCAAALSGGMNGKYKRVCVIDEREEIWGEGRYELGPCCHVISGKEKSTAIVNALRVLSPEIIIADETGNIKETEAILSGLNSGVKFICSIHADNLTELIRRRQFRILFEENVFDRFIFLDGSTPGKINAVYGYQEVKNEICRAYGTFGGYYSGSCT